MNFWSSILAPVLIAFVSLFVFAKPSAVRGDETILGDVNCDKKVDFLDIQPFCELLDNGKYLVQADINRDGQVDQLDLELFPELLSEQQTPDFKDVTVDHRADFFWTCAEGREETKLNGPAVIHASLGQTLRFWLYYSTNGPADSNITDGVALNVATSKPGIVRFVSARTFNETLLVGDTPISLRWAPSQNPFVSGPAKSVTDDLIVGLTAISLGPLGTGIREEFTVEPFSDPGYIFPPFDGFEHGRITVEPVALGEVEIVAGPNSLGVANEGKAFDLSIASLKIVVDSEYFLGDINLNGQVDNFDIFPFVVLLANNQFQEEGDCNRDGVVSLLDIDPFIEILMDRCKRD